MPTQNSETESSPQLQPANNYQYTLAWIGAHPVLSGFLAVVFTDTIVNILRVVLSIFQ